MNDSLAWLGLTVLAAVGCLLVGWALRDLWGDEPPTYWTPSADPSDSAGA